MADCGVASRRKCEEIIQQGRVKVNGVVVDHPGAGMIPGQDVVTVDERKIAPQTSRAYFLFYKPRGVACTMKDERDRKCVGDYFADKDRRLFPVGRLDYNSEGLLLMTDDGALAQQISHPSHHVSKLYQATVSGEYTKEKQAQLLSGVDIGEPPLAVAKEVWFTQRSDGRYVVHIVIEEGRNHIIRRMMEAQGLDVLRLKRLQIGGLSLGDLKPGQSVPIAQKQAEKALEIQETMQSSRR